MATVAHRDTIIPVPKWNFNLRLSKLKFKFSVGVEHKHHAHISRSSSDAIHAHDVHERKQMKSLLDQAKAEFATMMHDEKLNVKRVKKGKPEAFHQMVFRSVEISEYLDCWFNWNFSIQQIVRTSDYASPRFITSSNGKCNCQPTVQTKVFLSVS